MDLLTAERQTGVGTLLAIAGLVLYIWPAVTGPIVPWSDSEVDLAWARRGIGMFSAVPPNEQLAVGVHVAKPFYLLFLRCVIAIAPKGFEERSIVVLQSLLLLAAILGVSFAAGSRRTALCGLLLLFLRLRDAASSVMSEALAAAFLLPIAAGILAAPTTWTGAGLLGGAAGVLFWIRPNAGVIVLILLAARYLAARRYLGGLRALAFLPGDRFADWRRDKTEPGRSEAPGPRFSVPGWCH